MRSSHIPNAWPSAAHSASSWQLATSHLNLAAALLHSGRAEDAIAGFRQALQLYRELGDDIFAARVINHIAHAALAGNDLAHADRLARDALASFAEHGERQGIAEGLDTLAAVAAARSAGNGRPPSPAPPRRSGRPSLLSPHPSTSRSPVPFCDGSSKRERGAMASRLGSRPGPGPGGSRGIRTGEPCRVRHLTRLVGAMAAAPSCVSKVCPVWNAQA